MQVQREPDTVYSKEQVLEYSLQSTLPPWCKSIFPMMAIKIAPEIHGVRPDGSSITDRFFGFEDYHNYRRSDGTVALWDMKFAMKRAGVGACWFDSPSEQPSVHGFKLRNRLRVVRLSRSYNVHVLQPACWHLPLGSSVAAPSNAQLLVFRSSADLRIAPCRSWSCARDYAGAGHRRAVLLASWSHQGSRHCWLPQSHG